MYGDGKSDRLIVAEKRSNKDYGAPQSAEGVERSGLTKGNSFQQTKSRTQCRRLDMDNSKRARSEKSRTLPRDVPTSRRNLQRALKRIRQLHAGLWSSFFIRTAATRHYLR